MTHFGRQHISRGIHLALDTPRRAQTPVIGRCGQARQLGLVRARFDSGLGVSQRQPCSLQGADAQRAVEATLLQCRPELAETLRAVVIRSRGIGAVFGRQIAIDIQPVQPQIETDKRIIRHCDGGHAGQMALVQLGGDLLEANALFVAFELGVEASMCQCGRVANQRRRDTKLGQHRARRERLDRKPPAIVRMRAQSLAIDLASHGQPAALHQEVGQ